MTNDPVTVVHLDVTCLGMMQDANGLHYLSPRRDGIGSRVGGRGRSRVSFANAAAKLDALEFNAEIHVGSGRGGMSSRSSDGETARLGSSTTAEDKRCSGKMNWTNLKTRRSLLELRIAYV